MLLAALACACLLSGIATAQAASSGAPVNSEQPVVKGRVLDGKKLKAGVGHWEGSKPFAYSYSWQLCNAAGEACAPISGASAATYVPTSPDVGHTLRVLVTAKNGAGEASALSKASAKVAPAAPKRSKPATISGSPIEGKFVGVGTGSWKGTTPMTFTYQWEACEGSCHAIPGATESTYRVGSHAVSQKLRVAIRATNSAGSAEAFSKKSAAVAPGPPVNLAAPEVSGTATVGNTLTALDGTWGGTGPFAFTYQWRSCNLLGECSDIAGATERTYKVQPLDALSSLEVVVTASNGLGSATATSAATNLIEALLPVNTLLPTITGLLQDGGVLSALTGAWEGTGPLSFSYAWELCDAAGANCHELEGAAGSTLGLISSMVGSTVRMVVTASNSAGSTSATSEPTSLIAALLPAVTKLPSITGLLQDGSLLSALTGSWTGTGPLSFVYQWEQCDSAGLNCEALAGQTGSTLKLLTGLIGSTVRLAVTATNSGGSTTATSSPTELVKGLLPSNLGLPSITGLLEDGGVLSAFKGTWSGSEPLSFSYAWQLCDAAGANCHELEGAAGSTLGLISSMVGSTVRLVVTASNGSGSSSATSEATGLIGALLPSVTKLPSISGLLQDGSALTGLLGTWSGSEPISYGLQWQSCNSSGGECKDISGATGSTLGLLSSMVGSTVRLLVTATNSGGSTTVASQPTSLIKALLPSNTKLPSVSGLLQDGSSLSGLVGSWSGTEPAYSYQWLLCNSAGDACKEVSGATGSTLDLLTGMIGSTVRLAVTATNSAGATTATSEPSSVIKALLPSNTKLPSIAGLLQDGSSLSGLVGSWSGSGPLGYEYQWLLCNAAGQACKEVSGATGSTLGLLTGMIGSTVRLAVTATNSGGSTTATSEPTSLVKALLPSNTKLPSVSGLLEDGQLLTGALGSWSGSEPALSEQWQLCNAAGEACKDITGETGSTLGLLTSMIGKTVRLVVNASNSAGSVSAASTPTSAVLAILPKLVSAPSISGVLEDAQTLTGAKGTWEGSEPSYSYKWLLCNAGGKECGEISGATGTTLGLLTSEIGKTVRLAVTATNSRGSTTAESAATSAILAILPKLVSLPSITGLAEDGQTLSGAKGSWEGSEPSFSYKWLLCNAAGEACGEISKATGTTLGLVEGQIGHTLRLAVTATNSRGSVTSNSAATSSVLAILPAKSTVPTIAGILQVGKLLEALPNGSWTGSENPGSKVKYQWQTCGLLGKESECKDLAGAVASVLKLELAQVGLTMRVLETATNSRGSVTKASSITSTVLGLLLSPSKGPAEGGTAVTLQAPGVSKASAVHFGSVKTTEIEVNSPSEITVTAPAGAEGTVPVTVSTPEGTTHETPEDRFTYE